VPRPPSLVARTPITLARAIIKANAKIVRTERLGFAAFRVSKALTVSPQGGNSVFSAKYGCHFGTPRQLSRRVRPRRPAIFDVLSLSLFEI